MEMKTKNRYGSFRYGIVAVCVLTAGWFAANTHADDKPAASVGQAKKTVAAKHAKQLFYPALTEREEKIQSALQSDTEALFPSIPLEDVIVYFSDAHRIPISIQTKDLDDVGISLDQPIDAKYTKLSLKNALLQILDPIDLTYVVDREMILITSKEKAAEMMKTRVYPVGDLCSEPTDYVALEEVIRNGRLGEWKPKGIVRLSPTLSMSGNGVKVDSYKYDGGTISVLPQTKSLVISQTYHAQNAIVELLTQLRQARADQRGTAGQDL